MTALASAGPLSREVSRVRSLGRWVAHIAGHDSETSWRGALSLPGAALSRTGMMFLTDCAEPLGFSTFIMGGYFWGQQGSHRVSKERLSRRLKSLKAWSSPGPFCGVATLRKGCVSASRSFGNASPDPHPRRMTPLTMHPPALPSCRCRRVRELSALRRSARSHLSCARPRCERAAVGLCIRSTALAFLRIRRHIGLCMLTLFSCH